MKTTTWLMLLVLTVVGLAGCAGPSGEIIEVDGRRCIDSFKGGEPFLYCEDTLTGDCADGFYVGCDGNPDARHILDTYGLHQFTNQSTNLGNSDISDGVVSWKQGGFGYPGSYFGLYIPGMVQDQIPIPNEQHPDNQNSGGGKILLAFSPVLNAQAQASFERYGDDTLFVWNVTTNHIEEVETSRTGKFTIVEKGSFDGEWALVRELARNASTHVHGWLAINTVHGEVRDLFPVSHRESIDGRPWPAGSSAGVIADGLAFFALVKHDAAKELDFTSIQEYNFESMEWVEIENLTDQRVEYLDAGDRFVSFVKRTEQGGVVHAFDRVTRQWSAVERPCETMTSFDPKVGGDWILYGENCYDPEWVSAGIVAWHVPSGYTELILDPTEDFGIHGWDTDGEYYIVELDPKRRTSSNPSNMVYDDHNQLYWKKLPGID